MNKLTRIVATVFVAGLPLFSACDSDVLPEPSPYAVDPMFTRYVSIGNSITAGYQSGGITETMQLESYAALLAENMGVEVGGHGAEFNIPLMSTPGCPPPYSNIFTQDRVSTVECALRKAPTAEVIHNVAVPGSGLIDALTHTDAASNPNALTSFFLGGRTQLEAVADAHPTFVSVWLGNMDALPAAIDVGDAGNPALVTDPTEFAADYAELMDGLDAIETIEGGVLIGVVQVGSAPYLTQGRVWAGFELAFDAMVQAQLSAAFEALFGIPLPITANLFDVNANCPLGFMELPGTTDTAWASVPFHHGGPILSSAAARAADPAVVDSIFQVAGGNPAYTLPVPDSIDCTHQDVVTVSEMANLMASVAAYNAAIEAEADARDWPFVDPNDLMRQLSADTAAIRPFPAFPGTGAAESVTLNTPFGTALSLDGVHPSSSTHVMVANALIAVINDHYGTNIPPIN